MKLSTQHFESDFRRQIVTIVAIVGSIVVNTVSNIFPLNGENVGKLSNTLFADVQIIPANYAFAIWGLVYIGLIAFGIAQLQPNQRQNPRLQQGGYRLAIACVAQCVWIYLFLARLFPLSTLAMLGIVIPLIGLYQSLNSPSLQSGQRRVSQKERWLIHVPISLYLGWITVATVVNVAIALYSMGWSGWGISSEMWTVTVMVVSAAIAAVINVQRGDTTYLLVMVWALVGIAIRQMGTPLIAITGWLLATELVLFGVVTRFRTLRSHG